MKAHLILEDGQRFSGDSFGAPGEVICEMVFNTSMADYVGVLTDPSYAGQAVVMTYPIQGSFGVCTEDYESSGPCVSALIVRSLSGAVSNFRSEKDLQSVLEHEGIPGIQGIDTRALVRILRQSGPMRCMVTTDGRRPDALDDTVSAIRAGALPGVWMPQPARDLNPDGLRRAAVLDAGAPNSVLRALASRGAHVRTFPHDAPLEELLAWKPDGVVLCGGPGQPDRYAGMIASAKELLASDLPLLAVNLGHLVLALAAGAALVRLPSPHRGPSYAVRDERTGRVYATSQSHAWAVDAVSLGGGFAAVSHLNVNDRSVEGLRYARARASSVQFVPGAFGAPVDTGDIYSEFYREMEANARA